MDIALLIEFFKYCTIINFTFLLISTIIMRTDLIYNMHTKFAIWEGSKEAHRQVIVNIIGNYKILVMIFNAVPYFVLSCCI